MSIAIQLDFFKPQPNPLEFVHARVTELDDRQAKLRRGIFARHHQHALKIETHEERISKLEKEIKELKKLLHQTK